jgi:hypothetical protein
MEMFTTITPAQLWLKSLHFNSTELSNKLDMAMGLISKQDHALKFLSEKLSSEIEYLKIKLGMFENETLLISAKVNR